jgi:hypothetical protein
MGVSLATAEFLAEARNRGVSFERTCTIGRQALFAGPQAVAAMLERQGAWSGDRAPLYERLGRTPGALEPLLETLGARQVTAIDASAYEGADVVHDLNEPIPPSLEKRFTAVFDGGTIEHVFDVATVLRNYLSMVDVGGHLIVHTMANNYLGHGFYQFSPELFFRVLTPENGYELERIVLTENELLWRSVFGLRFPVERSGAWYEVVDPETVRSRVELTNHRPVVIQVQARRTADVPLFTQAPQQSDYVALWTGDGNRPGRPRAVALREAVGRRITAHRRNWLTFDILPRLLGPLTPLARRRDLSTRSLRNRRFYRRVR